MVANTGWKVKRFARRHEAMKKEVFDITGMTCSACSARIEKGVSGMEGTREVNVNLLKNSMTVTYDEARTDPQQIIDRVVDIG